MTAGFHERLLRHNATKYAELAKTSAFTPNAELWLKLARAATAEADALEEERTGVAPAPTQEFIPAEESPPVIEDTEPAIDPEMTVAEIDPDMTVAEPVDAAPPSEAVADGKPKINRDITIGELFIESFQAAWQTSREGPGAKEAAPAATTSAQKADEVHESDELRAPDTVRPE